jgi:vacuolar-type H+-ATPase subunit F/Vma7
MHRVAVIVKESLGSGFKLAGTEVRICPDSEAARVELRELLGNGTYGLVLIEEDLLEDLDERMMRTLDASNEPLVVPFPSLRPGAGERDEREYLGEVVRRAIGFQIRI